MLTHEQTTIRLRDAEISRLRIENDRLTIKMRDVKISLIELIKMLAKGVKFTDRAAILRLADELEQDV